MAKERRLGIQIKIGLLLLIIGTALLGCQASAASSDVAGMTFAEPPATPVPTAVSALPAATQTPLPVVVYIVEPTPSTMPGLSLPSESDLSTATPIPTKTPIPPTITPTPTDVPPATFTPPALPGTSSKEHYWFYRPIAEGDTNWTDKTYPYGSTRGGTLRPHTGVEFYVPGNTEVRAAGAGTVVVAGTDAEYAFGPQRDFYGKLVIIEHESRYNGKRVWTLYGHLNEINVVLGQKVQPRQRIALSGATGIADGSHLHFEVRVGNNDYESTRNPRLWLLPFQGYGTITGMIRHANGQPVREVSVTANRIDGAARYTNSTTYADGPINSDEGWQENFVLDDVTAGYYQVVVSDGTRKYKQEVWVYPLLSSFVEITIDS